jgi:uncharacterized protein DUF1799
VFAWRCWEGVRTQWRVGTAGATGLDYAGVGAYLDEQGLAPDARKDAFDGVLAGEAAMLEVWQERRAAEELRREAEDLQRGIAARTGRGG